jgi:hypothetical protein
MESEGSLPCSYTLPPVPILSQMNPTTSSQFLEYSAHFFEGKITNQKLVYSAYSRTNIGDIAVFLYDNLPTILAYPSERKCVTSTYELSVPKQSQYKPQ